MNIFRVPISVLEVKISSYVLPSTNKMLQYHAWVILCKVGEIYISQLWNMLRMLIFSMLF